MGEDVGIDEDEHVPRGLAGTGVSAAAGPFPSWATITSSGGSSALRIASRHAFRVGGAFDGGTIAVRRSTSRF
jgi:hypothetical protein